MLGEDQHGGVVQVDKVSDGKIDQDEVSTQLQQVYEYILNEQRPEAVGATELLAQQLNLDVERPPRFPEQVRH